MAFKRVLDERSGRTLTFASQRAMDDYVAGLMRAQKRLLEGKTLKAFEPDSVNRARHTRTSPMLPEWRKM